MAELIIRTGKHKGKKLAVSQSEIVIGRDETCRIRLASTEVSRRHCSLKSTSDGIAVCDLGSGNGTFVNGIPIQDEVILQPGDKIQVGPLELQMPGKRKTPSPVEGESSIFTEDDIAHWLTDDEGGSSQIAGSDTTIITSDQLSRAAPAANPRKQFKSIAEEAADIIRRHWDSVEEEEV